MHVHSVSRFLSLSLVLAGLSCPASLALADPAEYEIDPEHAVVAFMVDHIGFAKVLGSFGAVEGSFTFDEDAGSVSGISVSVRTASLNTQHEERDEHLQSDDFLDTRRHPEMLFTAASARRTGEREFVVDGELTLLGVARPLSLTATWNKSGDYPIGRNAYAMGVSARGALKRSDYGMDYGIANGWVGDEVEIIIEFEAQRQ
jgi:polyisoprenoid-binding protein YceI